MHKVKRITIGILGLAISGTVILVDCEKSDGPDPSLCDHVYNKLVLTSKPDQGSVALGPAISLNALQQLIITDAGLFAVVNMPEYQNILPIDTIGKITFTP